MNSEWIFQQGCAFSDCAEALELEGAIKYDMFFASHTHAAISLATFASELFLKCLLTYYNTAFDNIHKLEDLWNKYKRVNGSGAERIETCINQYFSNSKEPVFNRMLCEASNAFTEWRYSYEGKELKINRNFVTIFRKYLKEECCFRLYGMQWKEYVKLNSIS